MNPGPMDSVSPFGLLLEIDARARRGREGSDARLRAQAHWTGVGFSVLGKQLVAPMGTVTEILKVPPLARLPRVQPWVEGVASLRGRLVPVIGLAAFLGGQPALAWRGRRVLVLGSGFDCALLVDEVHGLKHFPAESFRDRATGVEPALVPYIGGFYSGVEGDWAEFRPDLLLGDARFLDAAR
ncbi:MAG: chemotaxis protein CheW [Pseudomonadales bacterium]|nr:chemotaxis protein CheW [Pseudomonadales bacterium]MCP5321061.1 chemotaxis protein CheW [Pseudomonadales bacterium]MCP5337333.1 chemotaxis protein CheW [Pseudomonadales bacterium]